MEDLNAASVDDVAAFFKTYYAPNNAVLTIVGDVKTAESASRKSRKYFERIPSQPAPPPVDMTEPPQTAERRQTIDDALARLPRIDIVWHTPPALAPDDDALTVLAAVLASGRSSRFYENIVRQQAADARASRASSTGNARSRALPRRRHGAARQDDRRPRKGDLRRDREGQDRADRSLGDREGAQQLEAQHGRRASAARSSARSRSAGTRCSGTIPNLINTYADRIAKVTAGRRPARGEAVPRRRPTARSSSRMPEGGGGRPQRRLGRW